MKPGAFKLWVTTTFNVCSPTIPHANPAAASAGVTPPASPPGSAVDMMVPLCSGGFRV
jgi:hypothetical protein